MTCSKHTLALSIGVAIILVGSPTTVVLSGAEAGDAPSASEIFKRAQEKYASLTSYSDNGSTVSEINGMRLTTKFTVKLARPDFYLIEWEQPVNPNYSNKGAVWSAGEGDFLKLGNKSAVKQKSQQMALASATGVSGSAAATIPGTFFRMGWGNQLNASVSNSKRQSDEKVGDVDCYVFTRELKGLTNTLYIGKQDFLIHQVRTVTSGVSMKATLDEAAKSHPEIAASLPKSDPQGIMATETHENIEVNQKLSKEDFVPHDAGK